MMNHLKSTLLNPAWHRRLLTPMIAAVIVGGTLVVPYMAYFVGVFLATTVVVAAFIVVGLALAAYSFWLRGFGPQREDLQAAIKELVGDMGFIWLCSAFSLVIGVGLLMSFPELSEACFTFSRQFWWWLDGVGDVPR